MKSHKVALVSSVVVSAILLAAVGWLLLNRQYIADQVTVWQYTPSSKVSEIVDRVKFSERGAFYVYASQTQISTADEFNSSCTRQEAGSSVLGCYADRRIYVYDVPDSQLSGIEEVTAAHEMLHAVWDRFGDKERARLGELLEAAYARIDDPALNERMEYYARTEPGERTNELHSILATEYANVGDELEVHFKQYFTDRNIILQFHQDYKSVFDSIKAQSDTLSTEMATLKQQIDTQTTQYDREAVSLTAAVAALQTQAETVDRSNSSEVNAYNAQRRVLVARIDALDVLRDTINTSVVAYNEKVRQYNALITSGNELTQSLDSTLAPSPDL